MNSADILRQHQPLWGEWMLGGTIGSGAQSQVFLVNSRSGEQCALKVIPMGGDSEQVEAVREQIRLTECMGQNNGFVPCLKTDEFGEGSDRVAVILMPLLTPLSDVLMEREEEISVSDVLDIACDLCGALVKCRENDIIHRDIKPANVFADEEGNYYLGDLGVARNLEHTMLATRKGTPAYMSPEIASGQPCSYSSDIYSLGIMLYQLLNGGRLPLLGSEARFTEIEEAVARRLNGEPLPMPEKADNRLGQLVCDMCAVEPQKRPFAQQCIEEFEGFAEMLAQGGELPPARKRITKRQFIWLFACCAAVLFVIAAILLLPGESKSDFPAASSPAINAFSSGGAAGDEQWLYFGSNESGSEAYRVNRATGAKEVIYDGSITHLNLCGDRLYFTANHTIERAEKQDDGSVIVYMRSGVRSMAANGIDEQMLCECETGSIVEYDGWIYHFVADLRSGDDAESALSRIMRVKTDGSVEEMLWELPSIYVTGMYVYRDRLYIACTDYSAAEKISYVLSAATDGSDMFRIIDGYVNCIDFLGEYVLYTTDRFSGSALMKKLLDGSEPAQSVSDMQAVQFCVYNGSIILCTPENYTGASNEPFGVFLCDAEGAPIRKLTDEYVTAVELAGDVLIAQTGDHRLLAVDIVSGEVSALEDFRFELY